MTRESPCPQPSAARRDTRDLAAAGLLAFLGESRRPARWSCSWRSPPPAREEKPPAGIATTDAGYGGAPGRNIVTPPDGYYFDGPLTDGAAPGMGSNPIGGGTGGTGGTRPRRRRRNPDRPVDRPTTIGCDLVRQDCGDGQGCYPGSGGLRRLPPGRLAGRGHPLRRARLLRARPPLRRPLRRRQQALRPHLQHDGRDALPRRPPLPDLPRLHRRHLLAATAGAAATRPASSSRRGRGRGRTGCR